jgi:tetratricopeptide (TPR) repeat protein
MPANRRCNLTHSMRGHWGLRGMVKLIEKQYEAARIDLAKAAELAPSNPSFHRQLGIALYGSGKATLAGQQFDFELNRNPKDAVAYYWRAKSLQAQGEKEKVVADLSAVIQLQPDCAGPTLNLPGSIHRPPRRSGTQRCLLNRSSFAPLAYARETIAFYGPCPMPRADGFPIWRTAFSVGRDWGAHPVDWISRERLEVVRSPAWTTGVARACRRSSATGRNRELLQPPRGPRADNQTAGELISTPKQDRLGARIVP